MTERPPKIALFVTCLVDLMRPSVGFAAMRLLERAGAEVVVPKKQTCCGQPAYNSGDEADARAIAQQVIDVFEGYDTVVVPSGSCGGMIKEHYPKLFADDPAWKTRAQTLAARTQELTQYLAENLDLNDVSATVNGTVTYHDSCAGMRELGIKDQPRKLLATVDGLELKEMDDTESCCGFGGLFSIKYPDVSGAIVDKKADNVEAQKTDMLSGGDLGCLMNVAGKLKRRGSNVRVYHIAEILAGMTDQPGVGDAET
ncbi:(Fe-S)-binding protein [Magnetovibrio sp. PR-2]|uniref:(Fe-S)-binding protein n=1 Tax=Magnetovibrio sp. PR-2 TaxID=3120356 RepID=UPI002FCE4969